MFTVLKQISLLIFLLLYSAPNIFAQEQTDSIKYSIDFRFTDGLFLNFNQVTSNNAIPYKNIISQDNYSSENFITKVLSAPRFKLFHNGEKIEVLSKNVWGYSLNGILHIQSNGQFYRVPSVGSISFFVANIEVEYQSNIDPWSSNYYNMYDRTYTTTELQKFLLDFADGSLYEYSIKNIEELISSDTKLFTEFTSLKKRKRRQMAFIYIRRFNENNPLYFPKH